MRGQVVICPTCRPNEFLLRNGIEERIDRYPRWFNYGNDRYQFMIFYISLLSFLLTKRYIILIQEYRDSIQIEKKYQKSTGSDLPVTRNN